MSDDVLVKVDNVSKRFCRSLKRSLWYGLQDLSSEIGGRRHGGGSGLPQRSADVQLRPDEFWAVKDVSFELKRGECLGLVGSNGSGKTTLLRLLNGLIKPDTGKINIRGRVGGLIALGAGFNPILTGRENIYINSSIIGLNKAETEEIMPSIIDFSELNDFIDTPVQNYSSGMQARLGFAIASAITPDLLLLDEVLAVGDRKFREKCYARISELKNSGAAIIVVAHSEPVLRMICETALLMRRGLFMGRDDVDNILDVYNSEEDCCQDSNLTSTSSRASSRGLGKLSKLPSIDYIQVKPPVLPGKNKLGFELQVDIGYHHRPSYSSVALHLYMRKNEIEVSHAIFPLINMAGLAYHPHAPCLLSVNYTDLQLSPGRYRLKAWLSQYSPNQEIQLPYSQTEEETFVLPSNRVTKNHNHSIQYGILQTDLTLGMHSTH